MLTELHLSNFKSWQALDMQLGQVTGLFGTNSSGKSSILQFLLMLKQTKDATDQGLVLDLGSPNQLVNLGSFKDIIHKHQEKLPLKWELKWTSCSYMFTDKYYTGVEIIFKNKEMRVKILEHSANGLSLEMKLKKTGKDYLLRINGDLIKQKIDAEHKFREMIKIHPIKTHIFSRLDFEVHQFALQYDYESVFREYESLFDDIYYLGPLREHPKREYQWSGASPMTVGYRGEYAINAILAATIRNEIRYLPNSIEEKPFQEIIAYWLRELGLIHEFYIKEIAKGSNLFQAIVKRDKESPETLLTDVGFGVSQILPVLVLLYYVPKKKHYFNGTTRNPFASFCSKWFSRCYFTGCKRSESSNYC
jgi:predicted ATPase